MKHYMIEGRDKYGMWDESVVGGDMEANTFDTIEEAESMIPDLVGIFCDDVPPPTADDFRVVEREPLG